MSEDDRDALRLVDTAEEAAFPMDAFLRASTFERSQAEALRAMLYRPLALVQGPPGSGKVGGCGRRMMHIIIC